MPMLLGLTSQRLLLLLLAVPARARAGRPEQDGEAEALVEWIRSRGGHVDARQVVRNEVPGDPSSLRGIFAVEDIAEGDLLMSLPWSETIICADPSKGDRKDQCGTAAAVRREMELGVDSAFAPYATLLLGQRGRIRLPNAWSEEGLALLDRIVGENLAPRDNLRHLHWWKSHCRGDPETDALGADAALLMVARACGVSDGVERRSAMVPYYDMYNHRNGHWHNTWVEADLFREVKVLAKKDIRAGEQIYNSYGEYTAADVLRDYGFVEQMPQLWSFQLPGGDGDEEKIEFVLDEGQNDDLLVTWRTQPPSTAIDFLSTELDRLNVVEMERADKNQSSLAENAHVSPHEASIAWAYHAALKTAFSSAIAVLTSSTDDHAEL